MNEIKSIAANETDTCPVHGGEVKREYTFGMSDADVLTYEGCKCACCINRADGFGDTATHHPSYTSAAGAARLIIAGEKAFTGKYGF